MAKRFERHSEARVTDTTNAFSATVNRVDRFTAVGFGSSASLLTVHAFAHQYNNDNAQGSREARLGRDG